MNQHIIKDHRETKVMELGIQRFQLKMPNKDILQNLCCYYVWEQMSSVYPAISTENKFNIVKYCRGEKEENFSAFCTV